MIFAYPHAHVWDYRFARFTVEHVIRFRFHIILTERTYRREKIRSVATVICFTIYWTSLSKSSPIFLRLKRELSAVYEAARCRFVFILFSHGISRFFAFSRQEIHHELKALEVALDTVRKELELHKRRTSATSQRDSAIVLSDENDNQLEAAEAADAFPDIPGDRFIPVVTVFLDHATNDYAELDSVFTDMKQTVSWFSVFIHLK